jgi:hypothetical protein
MYTGAPTLSYSELYGRRPSELDVHKLLRELDPVSTVQALASVNAYLRLSMGGDPAPVRETQRQLIVRFIGDESLSQLKSRFGRENIENHLIFHSHQILYLMSLALRLCRGGSDANPMVTPRAAFALGECCLMVNDLLLSPTEHEQLTIGATAARSLAAATQMLIPYEIQNPGSPQWLLFRSHVIFQELLSRPGIREKIAKECGGFDFDGEFENATRIRLSVWLDVIFAIYAHFSQSTSEGGLKHPAFAALDVRTVVAKSKLSAAAFQLVLNTVATDFPAARRECDKPKRTDERHDLVLFRATPLVKLPNGLYICVDPAILLEKIFAGVQWTIHDHLPAERREGLFKAWGLLCEEYVHWVTDHLKGRKRLAVYHGPKWVRKSRKDPEIGPPDDCWLEGERLVILEVKAGFLSRVARASADPTLLTADIDKKIIGGVKQLSRKIHRLFSSDTSFRRRLEGVDLDGVKVVLPTLIVQEYCLRMPLLNAYFNSAFQQELQQCELTPNISVKPLVLMHIQELERLVASADQGLDVVEALWYRSWRDPELTSDLHNFLLGEYRKAGYGAPVLGEFRRIQDEHWHKIKTLLFPLE